MGSTPSGVATLEARRGAPGEPTDLELPGVPEQRNCGLAPHCTSRRRAVAGGGPSRAVHCGAAGAQQGVGARSSRDRDHAPPEPRQPGAQVGGSRRQPMGPRLRCGRE
ncbi:lectin-like [Platysternon megacephalum]|uniref:Lectin-like n=1 Tax=Platysternon megacephalum TaxID=55544 RepID=A0A4D9DR31_9SAUR|nr:lectin-like [Platysternon megacephalum]